MKKMKRFQRLPIAICFILMLAFAFVPQAVVAAEPPFEGSGTEAAPYLIADKEDLCKLAELINAGEGKYNEAYYLQTADIVVNEGDFTHTQFGQILWNGNELDEVNHPEQWESIGKRNSFQPQSFCGIYDGGNHTISGVYSQNENGLFGNIEHAKIYRLSLTNSFFTDAVLCNTAKNSTVSHCTTDVFVRKTSRGYYSASGFINNIENCIVSYCTNNNLVRSNQGDAGGLFLDIKNSTVEYCINNGIIEGGTTAAGITVSATSSTIKNCTNNGTVIGKLDRTAGICGTALLADTMDEYNKMTITHCKNNGSIQSANGASGICGYLEGNSKSEISYCQNNGTVGNTSGSYGGIVFNNKGTVIGCINNGIVYGGAGAGGIALTIEQDTDSFTAPGQPTITQCVNTGNVSAKRTVGGICGTTTNKGSIRHCYNRGDVSATNTDIMFIETTFAGGIIGKTSFGQKAISVSNCYNTGKVSAIKYAGGIAGHLETNQFEHCYYLQGTAQAFSGLDSLLHDYNVKPTAETEMKTKYFADNLNTNGNYFKYDDLNENDGYPELLVFSQMPFTDVPADEYYFNNVTWAVKNGITYGMGNGIFGSNQNCTRAQFITFLWRASGEPKATITETPFIDCEETQYYYPALLWAYENKLVAGMTETTFEPDGEITRAQVVTFLWRDAGSVVVETASPFTDITSDAWYTDAITWAYSINLASGMTQTTFEPETQSTRAHVVAFLHRYDIWNNQ